jgi:F-type H+-transporting ATPase subunit b
MSPALLETLKLLQGLFVGAIPTAILFLVLWVAYDQIVHRPLQRILAERYQRTQGAMERAKSDIARAESKAAEYDRRLREARAVVFKAQEAQRQRMAEAHEAALAESRKRSADLVRQARSGLEKDVAEARGALERDASQLAAEVMRQILKPAAAGERA